MKIGVRKSPHIETLVASIHACGDVLTSEYDSGADFQLVWGWPQAEQVARDNRGRSDNIICVDCHPFALQAGDTSGDRIFQLGNWGALAEYPPGEMPVVVPPARGVDGGPVLVLGQVYTAEQRRLGLVDVWHTGGYEKWLADEMAQPNRRYRKHPRVWVLENPGEIQPTLRQDLEGCERAVSWNSTAAVHSRLFGFRATAAERHGWASMSLEHLAALRQSPEAVRSGLAWRRYRHWLCVRPRRNAA